MIIIITFIIIFPPKMSTQIFLHTSESSLNLKKLAPNIFFSEESNKFYKLSSLPELTTFIANTISAKKLFCLTQYDPMFIIVNKLVEKNIRKSAVPGFLEDRDWLKLATEVQEEGQTVYKMDRQKVFDFLEAKAKRLQTGLMQKGMIKGLILKEEETSINEEILTILKNQITSTQLVEQFGQERCHIVTETKKLALYDESNEKTHFYEKKVTKSKPKQEKQKLSKNQKTLTQMFSSKK